MACHCIQTTETALQRFCSEPDQTKPPGAVEAKQVIFKHMLPEGPTIRLHLPFKIKWADLFGNIVAETVGFERITHCPFCGKPFDV